MNKKLSVIIVSFITAVGCVLGVTACDSGRKDVIVPDDPSTDTPREATEGLNYTLSAEGDYYICSGIGTATDPDIVIAAEYNDLPVKEIGENAFSCSTITSAVIPENVTIIWERAFYACSGLVELTLP